MDYDEMMMCSPIPDYSVWKYGIILYIATPLALIGLVLNILFLKKFFKPKLIKSPVLYLLVLAGLDVFVNILYISFESIGALAYYHKISFFYNIVNIFSLVLRTIYQFVHFAISYVFVWAMVERLIVVCGCRCLNFLTTTYFRYTIITIVLVSSFLLRLPVGFEFYVQYMPQCPVLERYDYKSWLMDWNPYYQLDVWFRLIFQTLLPYLLLSALVLLVFIFVIVRNSRLGYHDLDSTENAFFDEHETSELIESTVTSHQNRRNQVRCYTWLLLVITAMYLSSRNINLYNTFKSTLTRWNDYETPSFGFEEVEVIMPVLFSIVKIILYIIFRQRFRKQPLDNNRLYIPVGYQRADKSDKLCAQELTSLTASKGMLTLTTNSGQTYTFATKDLQPVKTFIQTFSNAEGPNDQQDSSN